MRSGQRATGNGYTTNIHRPDVLVRVFALEFLSMRRAVAVNGVAARNSYGLFRLFSGIDDGIYKKNLGLVTLGSPMPMGWRIYALRIALQ